MDAYGYHCASVEIKAELSKIVFLRTNFIYSLVIETFWNIIIKKFLSHPTSPEKLIEIHQN